MHTRLEIATRTRQEFVDITDEVQAVARGTSGDGVCLVYSPHTTAGITINENADPDVKFDMLHALDRAVALHDPAYRHAEGNSAAHVKAGMMGFSAAVPVSGGRLQLGRWQGIYLCEFDGPRRRTVVVSLLA